MSKINSFVFKPLETIGNVIARNWPSCIDRKIASLGILIFGGIVIAWDLLRKESFIKARFITLRESLPVKTVENPKLYNESMQAFENRLIEKYFTLDKNQALFFSGVEFVFSMLLHSLNKEKQTQFKKLLKIEGFETIAQKTIMECDQEHFKKLKGSNVSVENKVWYGTKYEVKEEFKKNIETYYSGTVTKAGTEEQTNNEIRTATANKITDFIQKEQFDRLIAIFVNIISFKFSLQFPFTFEEGKGNFYINEVKQIVSIDFMKVKNKFETYTCEGKYRAVKIPYKDTSISRILIMPLDKTSPQDVKELLAKGELEKIKSNFTKQECKILVPYIHFDKFNVDMKKFFEEAFLGMKSAFQDMQLSEALKDQKGKGELSSFKQQLIMKDGPLGSEGSAVTAAQVNSRSIGGPPTYSFNRPFFSFLATNMDKIDNMSQFKPLNDKEDDKKSKESNESNDRIIAGYWVQDPSTLQTGIEEAKDK